MAYLRELKPRPCGYSRYGCSKRAVVELVNSRNAPLGSFCRRHGERELRAHLAAEKRHADTIQRLQERE